MRLGLPMMSGIGSWSEATNSQKGGAVTTYTNSKTRYLKAIESGVYAEESTPFGTAADELTQARYTIHDDWNSKLGRLRCFRIAITTEDDS